MFHGKHRLTRREALKLGLLGGAALVLPSTMTGKMVSSEGIEASEIHPMSPPTTPFQAPLPIPPVLAPVVTPAADLYTITMREAQKEIIPGLATTIWGYNGLFPGPTIRAKWGRPAVVTQVNHLPIETVIHLHGGHTAPEHDGFPTDFIDPGHSRDYHYPNSPNHPERGYTMWYHDHAMDVTGRNIWMGLAGFYILEDDFELDLQNRGLLPKGLAGAVPPDEAHDIPLVIQDRLFHPDGSFFYTGDHDGVFGDRILVNGAIQPYLQVATRKYRFRILNGSNARNYELALDNGQPLLQIGTEGGLLPRPVSRPSIQIAMAERVEVIIDFASYPVGSQVVLKNIVGESATADIMRFDVVRNETDDVGATPDPLRPLAPEEILHESQAVKRREFRFDRSHGAWTINGQLFDPNRDDATPALNTVEIWKFVNKSGGWTHPIHVHDQHFQVLDRNGRTPDPWESGWRETIELANNDEVRVIIEFTDFTGRYVFHCHNAEHEDMRMMGVMNILANPVEKVYLPLIQSNYQ